MRGGVDNSGVMIPPVEEITVQKYDSQFGTNVVGERIIVYTSLHMQADVYRLMNVQAIGYSRNCCCLRFLQPLTRPRHARKRVL